jgi:putative PIN family toxin of toxin-antitoxin system
VKAVVDTNVLVSGLLKQGTPPADVVADVLTGTVVVLYDQRILNEYRDVLARPKFGIEPGKVEALLEFIAVDGVEILDARFAGELPDPGDQPFADAAFTGGADVLITGNTKHFPVGRAIRVVTPREWLHIKNSMRLLRELGEDERIALEPNESFAVAMACKRCGTIRTEEILGLSPLLEPKILPFQCGKPNPEQPDGRCGGEVWSYDDNDLGRRRAEVLGIPTRRRH